MKIKTMQDLVDAVTKLVGNEGYFSIDCDYQRHIHTGGKLAPVVEWDVYHEDFNHYTGSTPQEAFNSFETAWNYKRKEENPKKQLALVGKGPNAKA